MWVPEVVWNSKDRWISSVYPVYKPLVNPYAFQWAQTLMSRRTPTSSGRLARSRHPYVFRGMLSHGRCGRRTQGNWAHGEAYYRCRFPREYAAANRIDHDLSVYVRESALVGRLDTWLAGAFGPLSIESSLAALAEA